MQVETTLTAPLKIYVCQEPGPPPVRPYALMEYTSVQRAFSNLPQGQYYKYSYSKSFQTSDAIRSSDAPPTIIVDFDTYQRKPAMDINKILDCFATISDLGATCSVKLFTDIPVDGRPDIFFNWNNSSPGHTFIQLKKSNLGRSITINLGLYPVDAWKTIFTTGRIASKFVDDSQHEYNASIKADISSEKLSSVLRMIKLLAKAPSYDIDDFNCTDFAIKVFNTIRPTNPLVIPKYNIPGVLKTNVSSTPQGLYIELMNRLKVSNTDRPYIQIVQTKTWVESSNIPCK